MDTNIPMTGPDALWDLATLASKRISVEASRIGRRRSKAGKRESTLAQLAVRLLLVHKLLSNPGSSQRDVLRRRVGKFLGQLEVVCTCAVGPTPLNIYVRRRSSSSYPLLEFLVSTSTQRDAVEKILQPSLLLFASSTPSVAKRYFSNIDHFLRGKKREAGGETRRVVPYILEHEAQSASFTDDYPPHVNDILFQTLSHHTACTCSSEKSTTSYQHLARLRLKSGYVIREKHVLFDVFYSKTMFPSPLSNDMVEWQPLQLHVPSTLASKSVTFQEKSCQKGVSSPSLLRHAHYIHKRRFCRFLAKQYGPVRVCLKVDAGSLMELPDAECIEQFVLQKPSVCLAEALRTRRLSTKMKVILAYILARSVWQFYGSDWLKSEWTPENIHFMVEQSFNNDKANQTADIYACRPCFAFSFEDATIPLDEHSHILHIVHRFPRILALGILLVRIGYGSAGEESAGVIHTFEAKLNNDYFTGFMALQDKDWPKFDLIGGSKVTQVYKEVVHSCFDAAALRNWVSNRTENGALGLEERRAYLFQNIVSPLSRLIGDMGWTSALQSLDPMPSFLPSPSTVRDRTHLVPLRCSNRRLHPGEYTVGWVSALPIELTAAQLMLDEEHFGIPLGVNDKDIYTLGRVGHHNVVLACLPGGQTGTNSAAAVAYRMQLKFPSLRLCLLVGIGGGVPSENADIRLGDVVISHPDGVHGGVVQYDFGKSTPSGFQRTGLLNSPPTVLLNAVVYLKSMLIRNPGALSQRLDITMSGLPEFSRDRLGPDLLFAPSYTHSQGTCHDTCDKGQTLRRLPRKNQDIKVHYGTIASGNQVMRDGVMRDLVSTELGGVLCFEMEAAGLMNNFPCLVIRGICDYADSHKNKEWQPYAAATAASCAKEILSVLPPAEMAAALPIDREGGYRVY